MKSLSGLLAAIVLTSTAHAATFNVTRMDDPAPDGCNVNDCSLREAVIVAGQTVAKDIIMLPVGVYRIDLAGSDSSENTGDLDISTDMEIVGALSTIDGQNLGRIMDIRSDANVTLKYLTLQNANYDSNGGALNIDDSSLTLESVTFKDNSGGPLGGAISFSSTGDPLDIQHSSFVGNVASDDGGALYLTGGLLDVTNATFSGNNASGDGGAIYMIGSTVFTMQHATLSGGSATRGNALYINLTLGVTLAELVNTLIDGNCHLTDVDDMTSLGGNIEAKGDSCDFDAASDLVSQTTEQLGLQPLADNLGRTPTHELKAASVARGQGVPAICNMVQIDQLYEIRGDPCNSGADESDNIFEDGFELIN